MNVVPLQQKGADQEVVTQFPMKDVEALGLLKMDFLGLRNLDVIDKAVELIGDGLDIADDPDGRQEDVRDARPRRGDRRLPVRVVGHARGAPPGEADRVRGPRSRSSRSTGPGPMQYIPNYANRKHGKEAVTYPDPRLKPILGGTFGISVYQEQSMEIAKQIGGFTPAEADDLRKAIGKKIHALMASLKDKFIEGCVANDTPDAVARQLWDDMEKAQDYSFNKSHAACYALISYRTAWLRANHPCEYMAALISSVMNTKDRVPFYVNACHELGIEVLPPDVNESQVDFAVVGGKIRFGLNAVKGVGELACRTIIRAREEGGPFESIWDFTERVDPSVVNKRALESLVKCGALPGLAARGCSRCSSRRSATARSSRPTGSPARARSSTFGDAEAADARSTIRPSRRGVREARAAAAREGDARPVRLRAPALVAARPSCARRPTRRSPSSSGGATARSSSSAASSARCRHLTTKRGEPMAFLRLDDVTGGDRVRRLQLDVRRARRALRRRPDPDREGPRRPQGGRDEADRLEVCAFEAVAEQARGAPADRRDAGARPA